MLGDWPVRAAAAWRASTETRRWKHSTHCSSGTATAKSRTAPTNRYTLTFPPGQFPPVNAFWSVSICDGKTQLLVRNPINRYLINLPMLPQFKKNLDGSIELYYSDGLAVLDKESNWLPAPDGPIYVAIRLYWPKQMALNGSWKPPVVHRVA
jgi:hypothetical protein